MRPIRTLVALSAVVAACSSAPMATAIPATRAPEVYVPTATLTAIPPTPTATVAPTPEPTVFVCREASGRVVDTAYAAAILPQDVPVRVYLPPCYDEVTDSFPMLILLHGKPFTETHWLELGVDVVVDDGIRQEVWRPFIMIMPLQPEPLFSQTDGGPGSYEAELLQGLLPFVDAAFRTIQNPQDRAIAGISRGGVWALEIGFRNPEVFGSVAALSPALSVNYARPTYDPLQIVEQGGAALPGRIFLGAGDVDWARPKTASLAEALGSDGLPPEFEIVSGDHVSATWQALMPGMLRYLTQAWESP